MLSEVEINYMMFIGPVLMLFAAIFVAALLFKLLFFWLPQSLFNALLGVAMLGGAYVWLIPMDLGFYEYFLHWDA